MAMSMCLMSKVPPLQLLAFIRRLEVIGSCGSSPRDASTRPHKWRKMIRQRRFTPGKWLGASNGKKNVGGKQKCKHEAHVHIFYYFSIYIYMLTFFYVREKTSLVDQDHGKIIWNICQHPCINARPCCVFGFCPFFFVVNLLAKDHVH